MEALAWHFQKGKSNQETTWTGSYMPLVLAVEEKILGESWKSLGDDESKSSNNTRKFPLSEKHMLSHPVSEETKLPCWSSRMGVGIMSFHIHPFVVNHVLGMCLAEEKHCFTSLLQQ